MSTSPELGPDADVVELCAELLRIDTSNYGDSSGPGERKAAEFVAARLAAAGLAPELFEAAPGRTSVVCRIAGSDPSLPGLVWHGHLDVVPAAAADWTVPPFAGEQRDGCLWGRGAVDMKDADAMLLSVVAHWGRSGQQPRRDIVVVFFADEEAGGKLGGHWMVDHHPEVFEGCTQAVGEVGGFSVTLRDDLRLYLIQTAEKGIEWLRATATGTAGHGSLINTDNAVTTLCTAVSRLGQHTFDVQITPTVRDFLAEVSALLGVKLSHDDPDKTLAALGTAARAVGATLRDVANPTVLTAGYKHNVIPGSASALIDGRYLPGRRDEFLAEVRTVLGPDITIESLTSDIALEADFSVALVDGMAAALRTEDPFAHPVPYMLSGGTDGKSLARLGIAHYGFVPLLLPPNLDFLAMFHGVDERVPVDALTFGARVLDRFLRAA